MRLQSQMPGRHVYHLQAVLLISNEKPFSSVTVQHRFQNFRETNHSRTRIENALFWNLCHTLLIGKSSWPSKKLFFGNDTHSQSLLFSLYIHVLYCYSQQRAQAIQSLNACLAAVPRTTVEWMLCIRTRVYWRIAYFVTISSVPKEILCFICIWVCLLYIRFDIGNLPIPTTYPY